MRLEHWFHTIPLRVRSILRRNRIEKELDEELQIHIEQRTRQEIAAGKPADEARWAALRAMDGIEQQKERCRDARQMRWIEDLVKDLRYAARMLTKTRGFSALAAMILALGIGANTAVFTIVNSVLLRPLPYPDSDRLFLVSYKPKGLLFDPGPTMVDSSYLAFRKSNHSFESLAVVTRRQRTLTGYGDPVVLTTGEVGPDFLRVLRVHPAVGREFLPQGKADTNVVLLSDELWRNRFSSDANIIGKAITLDGVSYVVTGVMPPTFTFQDADLWVRTETRLDPNNSFFLPVIGRLKLGVSPRQARAELQAFDVRQPLDSRDKWKGVDAGIVPLKELFVVNVRKLLLIFAGAVGFVFLIACANFANLLLIRGTGRRQEIAVRAALGASRSRLVRQLLCESTLLSLIGASLGVLLAIGGVRLLLALLPPGRIPRATEIHVDGWVLVFTLGLSLITGIAFGLPPALGVTRRELRERLSEGARNVAGGHERLRGALVITEIALALVLLMGAGLLIKSFLRMRSVNPGFQSANILAATVDLPSSRYRTAAQMRMFDKGVLSRLALDPETKSVAAVSFLPFGWGVRGDFQLDDGRHLPNGYLVDKPVVSPGYFRTLGIRLLSGRSFSERDTSTAPGVVIISESVARRLWPKGDAIGKRISMEDHPKPGDWLTIAGIVSDVREESLTKEPYPAIYLPYEQVNQADFLDHMSFVVQTSGNPKAMASVIRGVIQKLDENLPTQSITTMESIIADSIAESRSQTRLLGIFSMLALLLAAVGIYGVLASAVAERTHEIGIRMAIGATQKDILWMVFRRTLTLAGIGVVIGTFGALAITRVLAKFLFEVTPTDPSTFIAVNGILLTVALLSAWIPARRAVQVYPLVALRYE